MKTLLALVFALARVHCLVNDQLYIDSSCDWSYKINNLYNVTVEDLGQVCPNGSMLSPSHVLGYSSDMYRLRIVPTPNERMVEIDWEYSSCYKEYYMQFEASFEPDWQFNNSRRKCIRVKVSALSSEWSYDIRTRLHFNCLRIKSVKMGTLRIHNSKHNLENNCRGSSDSITFDLGCGFERTSVRMYSCLMVGFQGLPIHTEYERTKIVLKGMGNCTNTYDGTNIYGHSGNPLEGQLNLPVYGHGIYSIDILLVCNAYGEVSNETFHFEQHVKTDSSCSTNMSSLPTSCRGTTRTTTDSVEISTELLHPQGSQIYLVLTVILGIGLVALIVIVVFIRKKTFKRTERQLGESNEETIELQQISSNGVSNARETTRPATRALHNGDSEGVI